MQSLAILIPIALIFIALVVSLFYWATRNNQFDDMESPAYSIFYEEEQPEPTTPKKDTSEISS